MTDDSGSLAQLERGGVPSPPTLFFTVVTRLDSTPCGSQAGASSVGRSAEDLANALASLPGLTVEGPTEQLVGGYPAFALTMIAPASSADCSTWTIWPGPNDHWLVPAERNRLWIVDVDGFRLVISAETFETSPAEALAEQTEMIESIEFDR